MGIEIERKFLTVSDGYRKNYQKKTYYKQGYITAEKTKTVRIRIAGEHAFITIKGATNHCSRIEYEYPIPVKDADEMLEKLCDKPLIEKYRYEYVYNGLKWEIDEFLGENEGLILAEIELETEDQPFDKPDFIGKEVTGDIRYYNAHLTHYPYSEWRK
ncbi:CYTH domain-containing protein [Barnesiella propionica]|uniref:CYTH domain-containing protein n=1 Tax=Barnesiella propionica TaxID=2981781 RepID=UPI0011CB32D2|nr:CYTH domain-containing protein [Barnesiella propionica]MCU6769888.1 CYTH domain-containing protein [Barnesiella propionica]